VVITESENAAVATTRNAAATATVSHDKYETNRGIMMLLFLLGLCLE
jgi:hypothetical protein